jgi:NADPH-ferrihemoprotein reductase
MAAIASGNVAVWASLTGQIVHQLHFDDILAITSIMTAGLAYFTNGILWNRPDPHLKQLYERPQQRGASIEAEKHSRCLATRLSEARADVALLWASQSGTAERLASRMGQELTRHFGMKAVVLDISDIEPASCAKLPNDKLAFFLASTFGEGDPSDNMHDFWSWLHSDAAINLSNLRFACFGLGNSRYKTLPVS